MRLPLLLALAVVAGLAGPGTVRAQYVMDLGNLIAAIQVGDFGDDVERLGEARTVYVEGVARLSGMRISGAVLDATLARRARVLAYLRAQVRLVPQAIKALARHRATLDQVIFLTATSDGTATIYVDDR
ncbi:hypothetical protein [Devosia sp.]|uniref:hypothetical protein n=1 Tax=Devosia sp. TaxID=1871048 RepID=UPI002EF99942